MSLISSHSVLLKVIVSQLVVEELGLLEEHPEIASTNKVNELLVVCIRQMKLSLILGEFLEDVHSATKPLLAPRNILPVMNQLEIEVAQGTYLQQSQVKIMGASADSENQGRTLVDIDLVPLGEKFNNTTALLTYDRLLL
ncbi:hypothetical protein ACFE04_004631 [Oxalis oulophora]